ncbi:hypothetical protein [Glaciihabitans sp. dw_435]|uniref:hypothetical protein n=1 Tax=Glaciihabitans sp. dw_435 TaxID=2720081 RepID=UPI001BD5D87C|nr:hypothetical protein [Glaciihabitans sp. dw_435]
MIAYEPELWHELFVMTGGATAALAGLIFVAVSLNHEDILKIPALPALAARTLSILIGLVLFCVVGLVPGQSRTVYGTETLIIAVVLAGIVLGTTFRNLGGSHMMRWRVSLVGYALVASIPGVIAGISLVLGAGGGLYWLLAELIAGIVVSVYYGWILLIEIRR